MRPCYVGIGGSWLHVTQYPGRDGATLSNGGVLSNGSAVTYGRISDGSSNTLLLGEQSNFSIRNGKQSDNRSDVNHGFNAGARERLRNRVINVTILRHGINARDLDTLPGAAGFGGNKPLLSAHPGGVNVALADGSVHFLNDSIEVEALLNLADRDDGNVELID